MVDMKGNMTVYHTNCVKCAEPMTITVYVDEEGYWHWRTVKGLIHYTGSDT